MKLSPMAAKVVNPDIQSFIEDESAKRSIIYNICMHAFATRTTDWSATFAPNIQLIRILMHFLADPSNASKLSIVPSAAISSSNTSQLTDVFNVLAVARAICISTTLWQAGMLEGNDPGKPDNAYMTPSVHAMVKSYITGIFDAAVRSVNPGAYNSLGAIQWPTAASSSNDSYITAVFNAIDASAANPSIVPPNMSAWLFPTDGKIINVMKTCMQPYIALRFIASFVNGTWNADTPRSNGSFYDDRYGAFLINDIVRATMSEIVESTYDDAAGKEVMTQCIEALVQHMVGRVETDTGDDAMQSMYDSIRTLSDRTKQYSKAVGITNNKFQQRRSYLQSMQSNMHAESAIVTKQKRIFRLWLSSLIIVTVVAVILMVLGLMTAFKYHVVVVMSTIVLYTLISIVRNWLSGR